MGPHLLSGIAVLPSFVCHIANLLAFLSPALGSNLAQLGSDVFLHLLERAQELVKLLRADGRTKWEECAAGKRGAAKGSLELHHAQAVNLDVGVAIGYACARPPIASPAP